ncbi:MAG TPA: hypothetical protein VF519_11260 [Mycobacteriales bacterium]
MRFTNKQVVTMVCAVAAAVVLAPVGVMAATGQLVNIVDPSSAGRAVRVTSDGALRVDARSGAVPNPLNFAPGYKTGLGFLPAAVFNGPDRTAITQLTFATDVGSNSYQGWSWRVEVYAMRRTAGTDACSFTSGNWSKSLVRTISVPVNDTVVLDLTGSPVLLVPATGQPTCLGVYVMREVGGGKLFVGGNGYRFAP